MDNRSKVEFNPAQSRTSNTKYINFSIANLSGPEMCVIELVQEQRGDRGVIEVFGISPSSVE